MRNRPTPDMVAQWFLTLDVDLAARMKGHATFEATAAAFQKAKAQAKENHRRLAFGCHPDRGGDEERLKMINAAWTAVQNLDVVKRPPPPPRPVVTVVTMYWGGNTSTTTGGGWYGTNT